MPKESEKRMIGVDEAVEKLCPKPEHPGPQKAAHSQDIYETAVKEYHKDLVLWEASKRRVTKLLRSLCQPDTVEIVWEDIRKAIDAIPVPDFIDPPGNGAIAGLIKHKANEILKQAEKDAERVAAEISTDTPPIGVDEAVEKIGSGLCCNDITLSGFTAAAKERARSILTSLLASKPDDVFIRHIETHLHEGQEVVCRICGKTAREIIEQAKKGAT